MPDDINDNVLVHVDDTPYNVEIINGIGKLIVSNLTVGKHSVTVYFDGNDVYTNNTESITFTIPKTPDNNTNGTPENINIDTNSNLKTGNPILVLLLVLLALPICRRIK